MPRSEHFDDVYFSVQDGLAETRHVFLAGNGLPALWRGRDVFTVCETGFGTGLNFLALLHLWRHEPQSLRPSRLRFISFEKYPVAPELVRRYLSGWEELGVELEMLLAHDFPSGVELKVLIGDVNDLMPQLDAQVDCWFLDGFKPSSNPDMWSETVFENMARLSHPEARFATFTAAGFVRRGLQAVGFEVAKVPGYGRKREMAVGLYKGKEVAHDEAG
ncbi:MAG: tRNA (5-methylaminomethyl-2-thiouridine)(34)-methyltransferase MnmD [Alphaproteobacteria bacterium]